MFLLLLPSMLLPWAKTMQQPTPSLWVLPQFMQESKQHLWQGANGE
jgi:hypothetical protein